MPNVTGGMGGCLCGAVRYRVRGKLRDAIACHCEQCRKTSGHYAAFSACKDEDLLLERETALRWYDSSPGVSRGFCGNCGSSLFWNDRSRSYIGIAAASLDAPTGLRLISHIFVADKGDYYRIEVCADSPTFPKSMAASKVNPDPA